MIDNKHKYILNILKERDENPYNSQLAVKFTQDAVNYFLEINKENKQQHFLCCLNYVNIAVELFPALVVEEKNFIVFRNILKNHLSNCFDCVEAFCVNAKKLYQRHKSIYVTDFESNNIDIFFEKLGKWQNNRIIVALTKIKEKIKTNSYSLLSDEISLPVIFELLLNFKCLQNTKINELFISILSTLKQQGKFVKLANRYVPGLFLCALHEDQEVRKWAWVSFQTIDSEIKVKELREFEFDVIMNDILRKLVNFVDKRDSNLLKYPFTKDITEFWKGFRKILSCLENNILCDHYFELDIKPIIYSYWRMCNYNQESLLIELLKVLNMLLEIFKEDFWKNYEHWKIKILDIFESFSFQYLTSVRSKKKFLLDWVKSYIISVLTSNDFMKILEKVLDILIKESQKSDCDDGYKILCYDTILVIIIQTMSKDSLIYYEFYLNYSSKSPKFKTIFDNIKRNFSHEEIKKEVLSSGIHGMKAELLNKLKEDQKERSAKYSKRQVRAIEAPPNKVKNQWILRVQQQKENEARLIPNVNLLYKRILSLNSITGGEFPPKSCIRDFKAIPNTFLSAEDYVKTFEPLLILECWQNLVNSKEKMNDKNKMNIFMDNVCMVDDFIEVSFNCEQHNRERLSESDLLHVHYEPSEKESLQYDVPLIRSIAIIKSNKLLFYLDDFSQNVRRFLFKNSKWKAYRIMNLTSIIREYAALIAMPKFSLKNQILNPKMVTISSLSAQKIERYKKNFHVSSSQAEIIGKVLDNEYGFSLIQGPPGTGKSELVVSLISALRENSNVQGKSLICAPSNSIIDILVKKLKAGIYDSVGNLVRINIVYLRHLDSNSNDIMDVTLDFLAEKMMSEIKGNDKRDLLYYKGRVLEGADIICSTLIESGHDILSTVNIDFNTIIIDHATQTTELSSLIPLKYNPIRVIFIGDPIQSSPAVSSGMAKQCSYDQSLFVRIQKNCPSSVNMLKVQYRMHNEISKFPNQFFYKSLIKNSDHLLQKRNQPWHRSKLFSPYKFFDVDGVIKEEKGTTYYNSEAKIIAQACKRLIKDFSQVNFEGRVGIIIPNENQKIDFIRELTKDFFIEFEIDTLDAFQGKEKDIIILSCFCANEEESPGFLKDSKSLNVALTRAKSSLWIFGSTRTLVSNDAWKALIEDAKNRGCYTNAFNETFSKVEEPKKNSFVIEEDTKKNNDSNNRSMLLKSGLLVQFSDSAPPEEINVPSPSPSHSRSPDKGNYRQRCGANYRERDKHRYHSYNHDKRIKYDPRDNHRSVFERIHECNPLEKRIGFFNDDVERNPRHQAMNEDYNERGIEHCSSTEEDARHRRFKNERKVQIRHERVISRSPLNRF